MTLDQVQGQDDKGRDFGYVCGDEGGFFFTWLATLDATVASVEEDAVDGDGGLDVDEVQEYLRRKLPRTQRGMRLGW